ncbi:hypothetical protein RUM44_006379 [Polyplax serrata]|uniref:Angiotensin-converting enzyme n=1 Tax=Polyplax serrata TaxID=468196 RepID=A0ABR1AHX4_POLSC
MLVTSFFVLFLGQNYGLARGSGSNGENLRENLDQMNRELLKLNSVTAHLSWTLSTNSAEDETSTKLIKLGQTQTEWRRNWCRKFDDIFSRIYQIDYHTIDRNRFRQDYKREFRQFYLLCRGPTYNFDQNRKLIKVLGKLSSIYEASEVCLDDGTCFRGEPDLERIMTKSRNPSVLLWAWTEWRNKVGPPSRTLYPSMVSLLNEGARNGGYNEIGECWREELEIKNLETFVDRLYSEIEPFYQALHAVVRYKLQKFYGSDLVSLEEPIPAHLLGNMWAQNWGSLLDLIVDYKEENSLTFYLRQKNYTIPDLVKKAEDFFVSLGFRPMTPAFWKHSKLQSNAENGSTCHGTAANMFQPNDFRIILCAEVTEEDFSVIHHEMGHIAYYMEYENQPAIFQDGANSAFQESIGDAIMYGVTSPAHLHRLGLLQEVDQTPEMELKLLLRQALIKLPQIPFALVLEKWRWDVFKGKIFPLDYNKAWWALRERYQGVKAPVTRTETHFDPSGKFHINDNKPYARYFLSSILQMQLFESACKASIYGDTYRNRTLPIPLHKCDIYGSTTATKNLRKMMSLGSSITWEEAFEMVTGETKLSVRPLLDYYRPLYDWLLREIREKDIPVGWTY